MASLFEAGEPEAMELEPSPLHPVPLAAGLRSASPFTSDETGLEPQVTLPW